MPPDPAWQNAVLAVTMVTLAACMLFATVPTLDLWASAWFWSDSAGFWRADHRAYILLRSAVRASADLAFLALLAIGLANLWLGSQQKTGWRVWLFGAGTVVLVPGLLVNGLLKAHVGRARPADVQAFGGTRLFTPPFQIADQCAANCSFTSGEAAMVAALAIPAAIVLWRNLGSAGRAWLLALSTAYVVLGAGLRVAMGRHFLSDVVFSVLFTALAALALYPALGIGVARRRFHLADVPGDIGRIGAAIRDRMKGRGA